MMFLQFETDILSFDASQAKHSPRFLESWRKIANLARDFLIFMDFWLAVLRETLLMCKCFLEILLINLRKGLATESVVLGEGLANVLAVH